MKKNIIFLLLMLALSMSCRQKDTIANEANLGSSQKFTLVDYHKLRDLNWKGLLSITHSFWATQSYDAGQDWHLGSTYIGTQAFKDVSALPAAMVENTTLKIPDMRDGQTMPGKIEFLKNDPQGDHFFGKNVAINAFGVNGSLYVPHKIKLLSPTPNNTSINSFKGTPVKADEGLTLNWNADANNLRGVIIEIDFYDDRGALAYKTVKLGDDNGSFRLTSEVLSNFTKDCYFEVNLSRGNYHIADSKEDLILCLTSVKSGYKLIP
jgi:hypothetical protein